MPRKTKGVAVETTAIVLRIAADHATDFEAMFDAEEIPIWDDFMRRGRFLEARLVRAIGGGGQRRGLHGYPPHVVAAGPAGHQGHARDPPVLGVLPEAGRVPPRPPLGLVWRNTLLK